MPRRDGTTTGCGPSEIEKTRLHELVRRRNGDFSAAYSAANEGTSCQIAADIDRTKRDIEKLSKFAKRFSTKSGTQNFLAGMVAFKVMQLEKRLIDSANVLRAHERAAEILQDFSFETDPPPTAQFSGGYYVGSAPLGLRHRPMRQS